jgi:beta-lactamase regulating signal transducer with metallopeptidase domain
MLLPMALLEHLNRSQRTALLLHELMHIKRGDHWVRMLELTVRVAFWWLPIVGLIGRQLRACEETCCDAAVVAHLPQARRDYARLLLDVIDFANPLPRHAVPQATEMSAANDLEQRLRAILDAKQRTRRRWPAGALAVGLACAILPCELRYNFAGRPASAATSDECDPAAAATCLPSGNREGDRFAVYCCPS